MARAFFKNLLARLLDAEFATRFGNVEDNLIDPSAPPPTDPTDPPVLYPQMRWKNLWAQQTYYPHDTVRDGSWTMVANKETNERPSPQPTGPPFFVYDGAGLTPAPTVAKQVLFGNRYTFNAGGWVSGYRVDVIAGNFYRVFVVKDPTGPLPIIENISSFTAINTGWLDIAADPTIVLSGSVYDLIGIVQEPDPTPTTFNGNWDYITPNNEGVPGTGVASQANRLPSSLRINYIDDDLGDRTAELQALVAGDIINGPGGIRWAVQTNTDVLGVYADFGVSPATQGSPTGVFDFVFETTTATPITTGSDANYWTTSGKTVEGLWGADTAYEDIVPNDTAYGTDIFVQPATISDDWDLVAASEGVSGGGGSVRTEIVAQATSYVDQNPPGLGIAQQVALEVVNVTTPAFTIDTAGLATCLIGDEYTVSIKLAIGREGAAQESQIYTRALLNGTPVGDTTHTIVDTSRIEIPQFVDNTIVLAAGDTLALEFIRDTDGHNSGGLRAGNPDVVGWNASPSARIRVLRTYL